MCQVCEKDEPSSGIFGYFVDIARLTSAVGLSIDLEKKMAVQGSRSCCGAELDQAVAAS